MHQAVLEPARQAAVEHARPKKAAVLPSGGTIFINGADFGEKEMMEESKKGSADWE